MKNSILRILIRAIIFSLICGIVVSVIGLFLGWKTYNKFSDGFFWAGVILIAFGFYNYMGMSSQGNAPGLQVRQPAVHLDPAEQRKLREADMFRGQNLLVFLGTSGLLLFGLSGLAILIERLF